MNPEANRLRTGQIEQAISHIGAKVADAIEALQQAKMLSVKSEMLMIGIQQELEELYISIAENANGE